MDDAIKQEAVSLIFYQICQKLDPNLRVFIFRVYAAISLASAVLSEMVSLVSAKIAL
ncbi:MAG: hypothetical protein LBL45_10160 [Treponema sp.]|nr:hypothetical protein [Treponema sp.]